MYEIFTPYMLTLTTQESYGVDSEVEALVNSHTEAGVK